MATSPKSSDRTGRCPNCGARQIGPWCAGCGQEFAIGEGAFVRTVSRQWERIRHSIVALVIHPGQLTAEYRDGQRARSISPWRLAFNVIAVFFVLSFVTDFNVANFPKLDPSGTLANAISIAAQQANISEGTFTERLGRQFNGIFTLLEILPIAASAVLAWLTHFRRREPWSVHFVFALHFTAWGFIANLAYYLALRLFGLPVTYAAQTSDAGMALLVLMLLWQFGYVLLAFRRVYADGWIGAGAKAAAMVAVRLVIGNAVALLSFWLAVQVASHIG
jgi:hypothetical protein